MQQTNSRLPCPPASGACAGAGRMRTSLECLAKAKEVDRLATDSSSQAGRDAFVSVALHWRRAAVMAIVQERWTTLHAGA